MLKFVDPFELSLHLLSEGCLGAWNFSFCNESFEAYKGQIQMMLQREVSLGRKKSALHQSHPELRQEELSYAVIKDLRPSSCFGYDFVIAILQNFHLQVVYTCMHTCMCKIL